MRSLTLLLLIFLSFSNLQAAIRVGAFNMQVFGISKSNKAFVMNSYVRLIRRYDVIFLQEIRDKSGVAIQKLLRAVNSQAGPQYGLLLSRRLGNSEMKEQYAYLYRQDTLVARDTYQYPTASRKFSRPPFMALFSYRYNPSLTFGIIGIHVAPNDAAREINYLLDAYYHMVNRWGDHDSLILGDFNAGCRYINSKTLGQTSLRVNPFTWFIGDHQDTSLAASHCPYDRIVASHTLTPNINHQSAQVYYFDRHWGLPTELAKQVSDHYPVELVINNH